MLLYCCIDINSRCNTADAEPTERDMEVYNIVTQTLQKGEMVQQEIEEYKGCQDLARKVCDSPEIVWRGEVWMDGWILITILPGDGQCYTRK